MFVFLHSKCKQMCPLVRVTTQNCTKKQRQKYQKKMVIWESEREEAKELKQIDCPLTSFRDVMVIP